MTPNWKKAVVDHQRSSLGRSVWQLGNSIVSYAALWVLMTWTVQVSYWLTLALALIAAGFLARLFIIFHDCGHGSFFASRRANNFWGFVTGVLVFTPYRQWQRMHALHHASSGNLDRRGPGAIWTMTVREYLAAPRRKRFLYRLARNPLVLFVLAPLYVFLIQQRFPWRSVERQERRHVHWTNGALLVIALSMSLTIGLKTYVLLQLPVILFAAVTGVWLFYIQHQFEDAYWERGAHWDFSSAALRGSSFYRLPRLLQWFTGNIGFHHIHHLSPRIPNYNLERCHDADPIFQQVNQITLWSSMKTLSLRLWDERRKTMVGYRDLPRSLAPEKHSCNQS